MDPDRVVFRRNTLGRQSIRPPELVEDVHLIKLASGSDSLLIDFLVERNVRGLVLEAFGRGNVPPAALPGIRRAVEKGIPVVITTRTIAGRVLDVYGYEGGAKTVAGGRRDSRRRDQRAQGPAQAYVGPRRGVGP